MNELQKGLKQLMEEVAKENQPKIYEDLTGRTCDIEYFRKNYCGNKSAEWVRTKIFDRYPEVNYDNGGWVVNPRKSPEGKTTMIYLKDASAWMQKHKNLIDWNEKLGA